MGRPLVVMVLAAGVLAGAAVAETVEFERRSGFEPMSAAEPPLEAHRAGAALERKRWELAIFAAGVTEGQVVADVGCGRGRFTFELARAVGTEGLVYCRDTNDWKIDELDGRAAMEGVTNLDINVSEKDDVMLPAETVDLALLSDVYVYVLNQKDTKGDFLDSLYKGMKPGGVVVVCHVKSGHMADPDRRREVYRQTLDDFVAHGFTAGRRWVFLEEDMPAEILEFQRPVKVKE